MPTILKGMPINSKMNLSNAKRKDDAKYNTYSCVSVVHATLRFNLKDKFTGM